MTRVVVQGEGLVVLLSDRPPAVRVPKTIVLVIDPNGLVVELEALWVVRSAKDAGIVMQQPVPRSNRLAYRVGYLYDARVDAMLVPLVPNVLARRPLMNRDAPAEMLVSRDGELCGFEVKLDGNELAEWRKRLLGQGMP